MGHGLLLMLACQREHVTLKVKMPGQGHITSKNKKNNILLDHYILMLNPFFSPTLTFSVEGLSCSIILISL